jgi:nitrate reductase gamma subunit
MDAFLEFARGPLFRFAFAIMLLGLLRQVALSVGGTVLALRRADDKRVPWKAVLRATLRWVLPFSKARRRPDYSVTSLTFHLGLILVPIFLAGHIALWERGLGISWPALPGIVADVLTLTTIAGALTLIVLRTSHRDSRALSRLGDYGALVLVALPFASGFLFMHPALNPFPFEGTFLVHVLSADLALALVPFTKLCHCVLFPFTQIVSEVAWRFPPHGGEEVALALGKKEPRV